MSELFMTLPSLSDFRRRWRGAQEFREELDDLFTPVSLAGAMAAAGRMVDPRTCARWMDGQSEPRLSDIVLMLELIENRHRDLRRRGTLWLGPGG